ncbi:MAG: sulfatase/phosphatase domain-containing protein, partial [Pirellulales bacterium]
IAAFKSLPMIIRAPGYEKNAGAISFCLTELVDIYPTIVELAGLESKAPHILEGYSLVPLLNDPSNSKWSRSAAYTVMGGKRNIHRSIRTKRFRYSQYADGSEELYDHELDPDEHTNRVQDPQLSENLNVMRDIMSDQKKRIFSSHQ